MGVITKNQAADLGFSLAESVDPLEFASNRTECDLITSEAGSENMIVTEIGFLTETECDISTGFSEKIFCGDYCRPDSVASGVLVLTNTCMTPLVITGLQLTDGEKKMGDELEKTALIITGVE